VTESAHRGAKYAEHPFSRVVADVTLDVGRKPKRSGYRPLWWITRGGADPFPVGLCQMTQSARSGSSRARRAGPPVNSTLRFRAISNTSLPVTKSRFATEDIGLVAPGLSSSSTEMSAAQGTVCQCHLGATPRTRMLMAAATYEGLAPDGIIDTGAVATLTVESMSA
jgi:hypothetical protein